MAEICDFDKMVSMSPIPKPELPTSVANPEQSPPATASDSPEMIPPRVLVHCQMGILRSPTVVIAYLVRKTGRLLDEIVEVVKLKRKIKASPNFMEQLKVWAEVQYRIWEDEKGRVPTEPYRVYLEGRAARLKEKGLTGDEPTWPILGSPKTLIGSGDTIRNSARSLNPSRLELQRYQEYLLSQTQALLASFFLSS